MSDENIDDGSEGQVQQTPAELRAAADRGKQKDRRISDLERENAFLKAGIQTDDPKLTYFYKGYEGELTKEAIVKAATEAGFIEAQQQSQEQQQQAQAERQVQAAAQGAGGQYDPEGVIAGMAEAMRQAGGGIAGEQAMIAYGLQHGLVVAPPR